MLDERTQGVFSTIVRGFIIIWTVFMGLLSMVVMMAVTKETENLTSHVERAGASLGMALGVTLLVISWFLPAVGAAALGLLIERHSFVTRKTVLVAKRLRSGKPVMSRLTMWVLILGSCATATGQTGAPEASSSGPDWKAGLFSSVEQSEKSSSPQDSLQALRTQVTAKTVLVIYQTSELHPTRKAEQSLKKALVKWGRFQLVDEAEAADLIIVISEYSSSRPTRMERVSEKLAVFVGGSTANVDATPLWAVSEVGPALGQRPTAKLVEDFRKHLTELEKSVRESAASSRK